MSTLPLDADQEAAVAHRAGPCLVLAGPGSGKTRVIVERFLALAAEGVSPARQLVLTYTRKAAAEMRSRAEAAHGPFAGEPPLSNYHSFAGRVVREWGWLAGISPTFRIADDAERWLHLEAVLSELTPRTLWNPLRPHDLIDSILDVIGKAKQELVTPVRYAEWAAGQLAATDDPAERALLQRQEEVAAVYAALDQRYLRHAVLDHDDTILHAERLLREHDAPRRAVCDVIEQVMVDEYQDTNYAQARLVETLVTAHHNILVVADDDQAIYKFRGASLANLDRFARMYPDHLRVVLSHNYRSTVHIVTAAQAIIAAADPASRLTKTLTAERGDGADVELWEADDERSEMLGVASECRALIDAGTAPSDIAWLFRRHVDMRAAVAALRELDLPYQVQGGRGFFTQPEIKDLLALLGAALDPGDSQAVLRCLQMPSWQVSNRGRLALVQWCHGHDAPLLGVLQHPDGCELDDHDLAGAQRCLADVEALHAMSAREDVREVFHEALQRSNFLGLIDVQDESTRVQAGANLNKFGELLEAFADWSDDRRLRTALHYLEVLRNSRHADELASTDTVSDGITLLTAHAAKGLEWPVVVISGCIEARWPGRSGQSAATLSLPGALVPELPPPGDAVIDEERRLFYVAVTRARDRLVLTRARRYPRGFRDESPSPFLLPVVAAAEPRRRDVPAAAPLHPPQPRRRGAPAGRLSLGVSDLRIFKQCPRRFEYRRRYHMPVRDSLQSWYGTLIHSVLQSAAMRRLAGEAVSADTVAAIWQDAWTTSAGPKGANPELRLLGERQLRRYVASDGWREAPTTAIEETFTLALDHADVQGRWDRLDLAPGRATVVDYKTGPPRDEERVRRDLQVRAYAVAASRREHTDQVAVELHHLQTAEVTRVEFTREQLDTSFRYLSVTARDMASAWQTGSFEPHPSAWQCPRCEYRTVCDEGRSAGGD
jgi:DNA helicase-2/ATP-dependent DNA helicase PcrA